MLNYLLDLQFSPEQIHDINEKLEDNILISLEISKNIVIDTLNYYKEIGIKDLYNLIINRPDLVLIKREDIEKTISKVTNKLFVNLVNNDIEDLILFGI
jgi:hypothetical protein